MLKTRETESFVYLRFGARSRFFCELFVKKSGGREIVDLAKSVVAVGLNFESAFAGVRKTVNATEEEFEQFKSGLREISTQIPVSASELAAIAYL